MCGFMREELHLALSEQMNRDTCSTYTSNILFPLNNPLEDASVRIMLQIF